MIHALTETIKIFSPFSLRGESSFTKAGGEGGALPNLKWPSSGRAPILPWNRAVDWMYYPFGKSHIVLIINHLDGL